MVAKVVGSPVPCIAVVESTQGGAMLRNRDSARPRSILSAAAFIFLAATALHDSGSAVAQGDPGAPTSDASESSLGAEPAVPDEPGHLPFTTWDEGPEAIPFDSEPPAEQAGLMDQAERSETNSGYDVAQAWSAYSHERAQAAAVESARRLSGLTGTDDIGVTP